MLTRFTLVCLCVYFPLETVISMGRGGIFTFGYLIDFVAMCLLAGGLVAVRRGSQFGYGLLSAGWAWTSANFWRATMERFWTLSDGRALQFGSVELWIGPALTVMAMLAMAASLAASRRSAVGVAKA
jgi:hypothetical protein